MRSTPLRRGSASPFELEMLEPKILLSADGLLSAAQAGSPDQPDVAAEVILEADLHLCAAGGSDTTILYDPQDVVDGMFDGVEIAESEDAFEPSCADAVQASNYASDHDDDGGLTDLTAARDSATVTDGVTEITETAVERLAPSTRSPLLVTASSPIDADLSPTTLLLFLADNAPQRQVTTLQAAHGPPAEGATSNNGHPLPDQGEPVPLLEEGSPASAGATRGDVTLCNIKSETKP
ncbi:MAG: hypothetical protein ACI8XO_000275 [Verrucomicrobiales bacterium]|jgi:hypothetical protein